MNAHPRVRLHFTTTYAGWLNQVELWFGKIERDLLARRLLHVTARFGAQDRRYSTRYNQDPTPIREPTAIPRKE